MKKFINGFFTIGFSVLILVVIILGIPRLMGYESVFVTSASMAPSIKEGALVYIEKKDPSQINKNDIIAFHATDDIMITHRVVDINETENTFVTKGDANELPDKNEVGWKNVVGTVKIGIPILGYIASFLSTIKGKICFVMLFVGMLLIIFITDEREEEDIDDEEE